MDGKSGVVRAHDKLQSAAVASGEALRAKQAFICLGIPSVSSQYPA